MRTRFIIVVIVALVASAPSTHAQSTSAAAGWVGLVSTPVGGLPPTVPIRREGAAPAVGVRALYGHWQYGPSDDNTTNLAIGVVIPGSEGSVTLEVGHTSKKDCSGCGAILAGIEAHLPLKTASVSGSSESGGPVYGVAVEPAIGFMTASQGSFTAFSVAARLPLSVSIPFGSNTSVIPFVSPGTGLGIVSGSGSSESGMRLMLGGGAALATGPVRVTLAANKIFIQGGATLFGVALSYGI